MLINIIIYTDLFENFTIDKTMHYWLNNKNIYMRLKFWKYCYNYSKILNIKIYMWIFF